MSKHEVAGVVTAEEWQRIGREDVESRAVQREDDLAGSLLTGLSGLLMLAMLSVGPMWTLIEVVGGPNEHGPTFEQLWLVPFVFTLAAAVPLAWALHRERSRGRWALVAFLAGSLGIQLATCPWL